MDTSELKKSHFFWLSLGAIGVVYGDIGTSPLYTLKVVFGGPHPVLLSPDHVIGVLSVIFWALVLVVSIKYSTLIMRADNHGEGGIMALMALALRHRFRPKQRQMIIVVGLIGASLFYGDGIITPAISVLSAVEGLNVAAPRLEHFVVPLSVAVLFALFTFQSGGTGRVGAVFGPVMITWFICLFVLGASELDFHSPVWAALDPRQAARFFYEHQWQGFLALGALVLAVTGAEALYADMGHFGRNPIRLSWFLLVFPALIVNYFGQGALLLRDPEAIRNPFYLLAPDWALYPLIALSTLATIIASQAVISGVFSLTHQAIQLDYLPRQTLVHTSPSESGQIFLPSTNRLLMLGVLILVVTFQTSSDLASAYGLAVTGTMTITTVLASIVALDSWRWVPWRVTLVMGTLGTVDLALFGSGLFKIPHGGWFPLVMGGGLFVLMMAWKQGREALAQRIEKAAISLKFFLSSIQQSPPLRVPGTAVFMTSRHISLPFPLLQNFQNNKILHDRVILLTVQVADVPYIGWEERVEIEPLGQGFYRITAHYGFMQQVNIPRVLGLCERQDLKIDLEDTVFFIGRESLLVGPETGMKRWMAKLFLSMFRNASSAVSFYRIPPSRVMELGVWLEI